MAQDELKFSHITVTSDDEDDIVIQAGIRPPAHAAAAEPAPEEPEAPESEPEPARAPKPDARPDDDFRPTTADDLASEPMSLMQKVIIALAAAAVVAVVAYVVTH